MLRAEVRLSRQSTYSAARRFDNLNYWNRLIAIRTGGQFRLRAFAFRASLSRPIHTSRRPGRGRPWPSSPAGVGLWWRRISCQHFGSFHLSSNERTQASNRRRRGPCSVRSISVHGFGRDPDLYADIGATSMGGALSQRVSLSLRAAMISIWRRIQQARHCRRMPTQMMLASSSGWPCLQCVLATRCMSDYNYKPSGVTVTPYRVAFRSASQINNARLKTMSSC